MGSNDHPGLGLAPPMLDSASSISAATDVGPMYLHRDDEVITPTILKTGCWEPDEAAFLREFLRPGIGFLDVGANVGYFSLLASPIVGPSGHVLAVEPEPRNLDLLRANAWRNRAWNVRVLPFAAHSESGYLGLRLSAVNTGDHQVVDPALHADALVPSVRLDEILDGVAIDVVKVDVQGVDHEVVEGLAGVIAQNPAVVLMCEFWPISIEERGIDPQAVIARYEELGFHIGLLGPLGTVSSTTSKEVIATCRANATGFVNLVLSAADIATPMTDAPVYSTPDASQPPRTRPLPPDATVVDKVKALAAAASDSGGGYHVLRPVPGVIVAGEYDMEPLLPAFHLPADLTGRTVLDVGTASGFFAMECARRGANVTAIDVVLWDTHHWAIAELLNWKVRRIQEDIYDLAPRFGQFDWVICGSLLVHLPDPLGALRCLRSVCSGRTVVSTVSTSFPDSETAPICEFIGESQASGAYWAYWNIGAEALRRMLLAAGFARVEAQDHFTLTPVPGHPHQWSLPHTVAHGVVA